ncbi:MAG: rod shape-determining protein MreC [Lentisphaerae bacterium]|nr:rod shape-determining protein MreC [Lentisphaerota bacterium]
MRRNFYILLVVGILIAVLINLPGSATVRLRAFLRDAFAPFARQVTRTLGFGRGLMPNDLPDSTPEDLLAEITRLRLELQQAQALEQENRSLRQMLRLAAHTGRRLIAAEIIARDINTWWQTARLNKGLADGIALDMVVITPNGLAGRIIRISRDTSDILFIVDPACRVSARLKRRDAFGIVGGQGVSLTGQALCRMDFISKNASLAAGDEVVTAGLGGVYPPGLMIGRVDRVRLDGSGLYQSADIIPSSDFRSLDVVFIISHDGNSIASGQ